MPAQSGQANAFFQQGGLWTLCPDPGEFCPRHLLGVFLDLRTRGHTDHGRNTFALEPKHLKNPSCMEDVGLSGEATEKGGDEMDEQ